MALSPAHRFGQIIGEVLERATLPLLDGFAKQHGLYLDKKGKRPCRPGVKCRWKDLNGNHHDLDYVLERGGTPEKMGMPAAFIETAWRRYTKHSRNKAQEIQGAVVPLVETYRNAGPFMGAILAGEFTANSLAQLQSLGFTVLYFPYNSVVKVFAKHRISAAFDEDTPDADFQKQVDAYERISDKKRDALARALLTAHAGEVNGFIQSLAAAVSRRIERIVVLPLHGTACEVSTIDDAVNFITGYYDERGGGAVHRYEILIRYNNGDKIEALFHDKEEAVKHLRSYQPVPSAS
jgi:hypothetical protein